MQPRGPVDAEEDAAEDAVEPAHGDWVRVGVERLDELGHILRGDARRQCVKVRKCAGRIMRLSLLCCTDHLREYRAKLIDKSDVGQLRGALLESEIPAEG